MKERPILFSGPLVRAILDGRKTVTRRVVKVDKSGRVRIPNRGCAIRLTDAGLVWNPYGGSPDVPWVDGEHEGMVACPYGKPGDRLWVRETWAQDDPDPDEYPAVVYRADRAARHAFKGRLIDLDDWYLPSDYEPARWRPSIHMPRWASRITLEVTGVRVERLQEITEEDARGEGIRKRVAGGGTRWPWVGVTQAWASAREAFADLWDSINARRGHSWASNPWVWRIEFKREETP